MSAPVTLCDIYILYMLYNFTETPPKFTYILNKLSLSWSIFTEVHFRWLTEFRDWHSSDRELHIWVTDNTHSNWQNTMWVTRYMAIIKLWNNCFYQCGSEWECFLFGILNHDLSGCLYILNLSFQPLFKFLKPFYCLIMISIFVTCYSVFPTVHDYSPINTRWFCCRLFAIINSYKFWYTFITLWQKYNLYKIQFSGLYDGCVGIS